MGQIAFFNTSLSWGGGENWHFYAACAMRDRGWPVMLFCHPAGELAQRAQQAGLATVAFQVRNLSFLNLAKQLRLKHLLRQHQVHTLLLNSPSEVKLAAPAARLAGIEQIIFRRGMPHPIKDNVLNRNLFRHCVDTVIANSRAVARSLNKANPQMVAKDKIHIIHNGMDLAEFDQRAASRLQEPLAHTVVLGTAGRCVKQKNLSVLLDVAHALKQRGADFKLLIAGTGELKAELKKKCVVLELQSHVEFTGFVSNIKDLLSAIDIFVFPSLYEGSSNAVIEACAMALPVVAFDIDSITEIIEHGIQGLLAPQNDVQRFTELCQQLVEQPKQRQEMGRQGRQRIEQEFSADLRWQQLSELLVKH